ncbi:MAG: hypothetical protein AUI14_15235 [Actinobacteria bacterium 13_2_20CM_2_71_6]|nr:MAG: hypothetical protein AUI14_15235 [Actinobacteria bacterium 13_2_20CM_2_71_6]
MPDVDGRVAVVTGASRGIGLAIARRLVQDGWRVCVTARTPETLAAAAEELNAVAKDPGGGAAHDLGGAAKERAGGAAHDLGGAAKERGGGATEPAGSAAQDLGGGAANVPGSGAAPGSGNADRAIAVAGKADDPAHQAEAVARTMAAYGRLDLLVNNTGINPVYGPMLSLDPAAIRKIFEVNVFASLGWLRQAYDAWLGEHGGAVVNVASIAGLQPSEGLGAYAVSKAALIHLTRQLAIELAPGIRVNAVAPAVVRTEFARKLYEGHEEALSKRYPLGRLGVPDDVAGAVAYLASPDAAWVTGQTLVLDGGLTQSGQL